MDKGRRLKAAERPDPVRGTIAITKWDRDKNNFRRNITMASLYLRYGTSAMSTVAAIFDPVIVPHSGHGFLLSGIQLQTNATDIIEHRQVWLVVPQAG